MDGLLCKPGRQVVQHLPWEACRMHYREFIAMHGYKLIKIIENEAILEGYNFARSEKKN
jgi:hypothetical protein